MNSEKVKEIKKALEYAIDMDLVIGKNTMFVNIKLADILTLINELESENERLSNTDIGELIEENEKLAKQCVEWSELDFKKRNKITELKDRIALLEKDNELLRNAKVVYENVDYCYEDLKKAEKRIAELEKENAKLKSTNTNILKGCDEYKNRHLKQFAESYRKKLDEQMRFYKNADIGYRDISITALNGAYKYLDETLKEFIND